MSLFTRRQFILGLGALGFLGLTRWEYVYGKVWPQPADDPRPESLPVSGVTPEPIIPVVDCDYFLQGGLIVDGTGSLPYIGNIAIKGDTIIEIGEILPSSTARRIDVTGLVVTPGFIDVHTHTENYLATSKSGEMILKQGVTTQIGGNCGSSVASIQGYFDRLGFLPVNMGLFVGYKTLRAHALNEPATVTNVELTRMKELLAEGLRAGAFGLSVGLGYTPQHRATTEELIELCKVVKEHGGFYSTHIRNEDDYVIKSLREAITIGFKAQVPVQYSHVKAAGNRNWGKMPKILGLIEEARYNGLDITGDIYGYNYSSLDVAVNSRVESMAEEDVILAMQHKHVMFASDSGLTSNGVASHPRAYGNYNRILSQYVRDQQILPLEEAIRKMTSLPAKRLGLKNRGRLAKGYKADISVFNLADMAEQGTRTQPNQLPLGMKYVFVNGGLALAEGEVTGMMTGQALKKRM